MDKIRHKINNNEEVYKEDLFILLECIGFSRSGKTSNRTIEEIKVRYKNIPQSVANYLEYDIASIETKGYNFFSADDILQHVEELVINNTWNNHFMPIGYFKSL